MKIKNFLSQLSILALATVVVPAAALAAEVSPRSITLGSSAPSAVTTHLYGFTVPTTGNVGSIEFKYCTTATGACTTPAGLVTTAASLSNQTGATGFSLNNTTNGAPFIFRAPSSIPATTQTTYTLSNVTNPSGINTEYWARISTFATNNATGGATDAGTVAFVTTTQITVSGSMPESIVFCVGTSGTNCTNMTGNAVNLGTFSPTIASTGTSVMSASTNASFGYVITLVGSAMASGANTITAMGQQSPNGTAIASSPGTAQFGTNLRANTAPAVGADVSGLGTGTPGANYGTLNAFRYFTGDTVATAAGPVKDNLYTSSYVVNVSPDQAAGVYTATMTYICTATF